jgi:hypothetical protein
MFACLFVCLFVHSIPHNYLNVNLIVSSFAVGVIQRVGIGTVSLSVCLSLCTYIHAHEFTPHYHSLSLSLCHICLLIKK